MCCSGVGDDDGESGGGCSGDDLSSGGSSGDESDVSSIGHPDNQCDCCYCHRQHLKNSGGRQKYSDRRERLLRILNQKKNAQQSSTCATCPDSFGVVDTTIMQPVTAAAVPTVTPQPEEIQVTETAPSKDIDSLINYIEGKSSQDKNKKSNKRNKQRVRKVFTG